ncbi:MAG: serine/threonine protein kinase [Deltaproteobacteria bacterium]|nr:serine/threonine protein kinase [Deltaproteobacteria bacterium]
MTPGSHIGQYRILRKLGAGGMGTIFLAEHILLGRQAAIKTLLPTLSVHKEIVERFFNEARATSSINDPGVVQVFDFGFHVDGTAYIVMELLEGEALADRMDRMGAMPQADALKIARQVASALAAAHERGIVHRDLKPENIYLVRDAEAQCGERTKILDFGICKLEGDEKLTQSGATLGTPVYMSPEQCRGSGAVDLRSDIYALGCVLFHMITGRTPFECEGVGEYIVAHLQQQPPAASTIVPGLHPLVDVLLIRCLAKDPAERFQSMAEVQEAVGQVMSRLSAPGVSPMLPAAGPVLGVGFRSGNGAEPPAPVPTPKDWYVDSTPPPDAPDISYAGEPLPRFGMSAGRKLAFAAICIGGLVTAMFATRSVMGDDPSDVPEVSTAALRDELTDVQVAQQDPAPPPPTEATVDRVEVLAFEDPAPGALRAAVESTKPVRARPSSRPARREATVTREPEEVAPVRVPSKLPAPPPPTEDLYDTR